jgi:hypothetical protein
MRTFMFIATALVTFGAAFLSGADAYAASSGYWNNSGFAISHQYYPGLRSSYSYFNYAPRYYGFNHYRFGGSGRRHGDSASEPEIIPASSDNWAKKCGSSCVDLTRDQ